MSSQQRKKQRQQAPDVPIATCKRHTALDNIKLFISSWYGQNWHNSHCVNKNKHESDVAEQSLKHHQSSPNSIHTKYVNLRIPPRRERRVLFAELQQSRWAINSNPTVVSHYYRRIPHRSCSSNKLRSATCRCGYGVLLLRDVLCLTHLCALSIRQST